jgi:hypothetical protein
MYLATEGAATMRHIPVDTRSLAHCFIAIFLIEFYFIVSGSSQSQGELGIMV